MPMLHAAATAFGQWFGVLLPHVQTQTRVQQHSIHIQTLIIEPRRDAAIHLVFRKAQPPNYMMLFR